MLRGDPGDAELVQSRDCDVLPGWMQHQGWRREEKEQVQEIPDV